MTLVQVQQDLASFLHCFTGPDIFNHMRSWYDEIECNNAADFIVIPDGGQSRKGIARAWAEAYEQGALYLTPGNQFRCTYVEVRDVEIDANYPRAYYPEFIGNREAFLIQYSVVFVPDDWRSHMAGNTAAYKDSDAPEGAYQYWRYAYLYLDIDSWHSDGAGTGP